MKKHIVRIAKRSLSYFLKGYTVASIPLSFIGAASSAYYLFFEKSNILKNLFPSFTIFILSLGFPLIVFAGLVGYAYFKKTWLFRTDVEVQQESNEQVIITHYLGMWYELKLMEKLGVIPTKSFMERLDYWKMLYRATNWFKEHDNENDLC